MRIGKKHAMHDPNLSRVTVKSQKLVLRKNSYGKKTSLSYLFQLITQKWHPLNLRRTRSQHSHWKRKIAKINFIPKPHVNLSSININRVGNPSLHQNSLIMRVDVCSANKDGRWKCGRGRYDVENTALSFQVEKDVWSEWGLLSTSYDGRTVLFMEKVGDKISICGQGRSKPMLDYLLEYTTLLLAYQYDYMLTIEGW